jgi:hypothetical protein
MHKSQRNQLLEQLLHPTWLQCVVELPLYALQQLLLAWPAGSLAGAQFYRPVPAQNAILWRC